MENNIGQVVLVKDINPGVSNYGYNNRSFPRNLIELDDKLYFAANDEENGAELWVSDGTTGGTNLVADINPGSYGSYPQNLIEFNNKLYFSARDEENGNELWVSDGTTEGTNLIADINPGSYSSHPENLIEFNNKLYFSADDGENGDELWVSDGTTEGTSLLTDLRPGVSNYGGYGLSSYPENLTEVNSKLYFSAFGENGEDNLWKSDGTTEGTKLVAEINSGNRFFPYTSEFIEFNDKLYFNAFDVENGRELWVSDGTTEGTRIVADITPGDDGSYPRDFIEFNGKLYFGAFTDNEGRELWVTDGTTEGTQLVIDLYPGTDTDGFGFRSSPNDFVEFNDKLYFRANGGEDLLGLWVSDGTAEGTQLVAAGFDFDNRPDAEASNLVELNDKLYFNAFTNENGRELWVTDGTTEGTQLVADLNPGSNNSDPLDLTVFDNELFFQADNGETGGELFKLTFDNSHQPQQPVPTNAIDGTNGKDNLVGGDGADIINGFNGKDTIDGGAGDDELFGGNGKDYLVGGAGDDTLAGGNGKDTLDGGIGSDILTGGRGKDTFVIASSNGEDTITDFEQGKDSLGLVDLEFHDLSFSGNTIYAGDELLANLTNVNTESLSEDNFTLM